MLFDSKIFDHYSIFLGKLLFDPGIFPWEHIFFAKWHKSLLGVMRRNEMHQHQTMRQNVIPDDAVQCDKVHCIIQNSFALHTFTFGSGPIDQIALMCWAVCGLGFWAQVFEKYSKTIRKIFLLFAHNYSILLFDIRSLLFEFFFEYPPLNSTHAC